MSFPSKRLRNASVSSSLRRLASAAYPPLSPFSCIRWQLVQPLYGRSFSTATPGKIRVHVKSEVDGKAVEMMAPVGLTLMEAIRDVGRLDMEAACDGTCACSTCHVIFSPDSFEKLPGKPSEDEMDMLDLAPAVSPTSRLSCQVQLTEELDGIALTIPDEMQNQMR